MANLPRQARGESARPPKPPGAHVPSDVGVLVRPSLACPLGLLGSLPSQILSLASWSPAPGATRRRPHDAPPGAHERLPSSSQHDAHLQSGHKGRLARCRLTVLPAMPTHKRHRVADDHEPRNPAQADAVTGWPLVRAGSARGQEPAVRGGRERSRPVCRTAGHRASTPETSHVGTGRGVFESHLPIRPVLPATRRPVKVSGRGTQGSSAAYDLGPGSVGTHVHRRHRPAPRSPTAQIERLWAISNRLSGSGEWSAALIHDRPDTMDLLMVWVEDASLPRLWC